MPPPIAQVEPLTTARALRGPFDYERPDGVGVGSVLVVPFGHRDVVGVVTGLTETSEHERRRAAAGARDRAAGRPRRPRAVDGGRVRVDPGAGAVAAAAAEGHAAQDGAVRGRGATVQEGERLTDAQRALLDSLPRFTGPDTAALRRLEARGLVTIGPRVVRRAPVHVAVGARRARPPLTAEQEAALLAIRAAAPGEGLLLHGVTGSGKTEVYLRAAAETLAAGRGVIVLVPEIALTPQIVARFVERFGDTVAVLHSKLSDGERHDEWARLRRGEARVCVGPRSAVFAPLADVGLVVVDEEHDPSYKHEGDPRYDARRVADAPGADRGRGARRRQRDAAAGERPGAAAPAAVLAGRRPGAAAGGDRGHARGAAGAAPAHARRARRRAQDDRAAQPPRLVELPDVPDRAGGRGSARRAT